LQSDKENNADDIEILVSYSQSTFKPLRCYPS